ncbi:acyl-CoA-binding protein [Myxozyma melibiosi]|uniref:Acyl-CoA-binding protein n=1 Tax=Myxozyma melibiosi TaxID=54550 RepID=A0ABR1FE64_9ASCO
MPSAEFQAAADAVQKLPSKPTDDELLSLYGLFKQATVGDNDTPKPGVFDLKGKYKWNAWDKLKGKSTEEAEKEYIALAESLIAKYGSS